ncbi:hypothetical protein [Nocardia sp. N2S4-5]|uniref:hypothetical protein n=1 Tax=Nocardia sp. N2S4-5 TaxID=3351565 RepID=UPI0037D5D5B1
MNDDQLGFDIDATAEMTPWQVWVDPQRHHAQTRKLLARAGLPGLPTEPWDYDKNDEIHQLNDFLMGLFPDLDAVTSNPDDADQLACLIGQWFTKYLDAKWIDVDALPPIAGINDTDRVSLYTGFTPALTFPYPGWRACTADRFVASVVENEILDMAELVAVGYSRLHKPDTAPFSEVPDFFRDTAPFL